MRLPIITLSCGLITVIAISLVVRDLILVRGLALILLIALAGIGICLNSRFAVRPQNGRVAIVIGTMILLTLGLINAPLKVVFSCYEPRFDVINEQLQSGERPVFSIWIGPFRIVDGGIRDGTNAPYLMTSGHLYEINGFVRDPKGLNFNLWSITTVGDAWAYIQED